ncbi:MAG: hypothetical protein H0T20_08935 [Actinobacteria bacterium]|nr:hypothetical protein [Actinomycetota bacterium]
MLLTAIVLVAAGCGGSDKEAATTVAAVSPAKTQAEWIDRLVNRFLLDMQKNLNVVNGLRSNQAIINIRTGNETTIRVLTERMTDLAKCTGKLARVGPPPVSEAPLDRIYDRFGKSCPYYERIASAALKATPLLSSRDSSDVAKGEQEFAKISDPSFEAARHFSAALELLEENKLLQAYQG